MMSRNEWFHVLHGWNGKPHKCIKLKWHLFNKHIKNIYQDLSTGDLKMNRIMVLHSESSVSHNTCANPQEHWRLDEDMWLELTLGGQVQVWGERASGLVWCYWRRMWSCVCMWNVEMYVNWRAYDLPSEDCAHPLLIPWLWTACLASLSLSFLAYKMELMLISFFFFTCCGD